MARPSDQALVSDQAPAGLDPSGFDPSRWVDIDRRADQDTGDEAEDSYYIGRRDGYQFAIQTLDILTGGDGEYRYCTDHRDWPNTHCPDAGSMQLRILERFDSLKRAASGMEARRAASEAAVHDSPTGEAGDAQEQGG